MLRLLRHRLLFVLIALVVLVGMTAYLVQFSSNGSLTAAQRDLWPGTGEWAQAQLDQMTLEQKVSQLFSAYAYGYYNSTDDPAYRRLVDLVERFGVGGLIFFQGDPLEQASLANALQEKSRLPLLISQDMEWGAGMRIDRTTTFPRTMAFGATREPAYARAAGYVTAQEARALGTHHIFAPVADVNNNPGNPIINTRSFSERPELVAEMTAAFIQGVQEGGALATAKHFPGHGDTAVDSHSDLPVLPFTRARLDTLELVPFRAAVDAGVMSVMIGHLALPAIEPDSTVPATLSSRVVTGLLREQMGFGGLVVTDAMNMEGVTSLYGVGEAAVRALEAGVDMLLMTKDEYAARAAILRALDSGRLTEERIDRSVMRVLRAKEWLKLDEQRLVALNAVRENVATRPHLALSETVAHASLTLLRNEGGLLPLAAGEGTTRRVLTVTLSDSEDPGVGRAFTDRVQRHAAGEVATRLLDRRSRPADYAAALEEAAAHDVILLPTFVIVRAWSGRIGLSEEHRAFVEALVETGKPVVMLAFGNPYVVMGLEQPAAYVAAYGQDDRMQSAAADALFGRSGFHGRLPITIPGAYDFGDGLVLEQILPREAFPEEAGLDGDVLLRIDSLMRAALDDPVFPGAAVAVGRGDLIAKLDGYGYFTYDAETPVTPQSVFDLASLTKVIATTTAAMLLHEQGRLDLDAKVVDYLPAFGQNGKSDIKIRHLLSHTAGLIPFRPFHTMGLTTRDAVLDAIFAEELLYEPGSESRYSDLGLITLALLIEQITGQEFAAWTKANIFAPLGMTRTGFRAVGQPDETVVPTEIDRTFRKRLMQGEVHDEAAWILGGTAGHAGLFSTAEDLATFATMLVNEGALGGKQFLQPETIKHFTTRVDWGGGEHTRALGWDTRSTEGYSSAGQLFGARSFGHTGFTGTSLWVDPDEDLYVILLTNRVHPTRENSRIGPIRPQLADLAHRAIVGPPRFVLPGE